MCAVCGKRILYAANPYSIFKFGCVFYMLSIHNLHVFYAASISFYRIRTRAHQKYVICRSSFSPSQLQLWGHRIGNHALDHFMYFFFFQQVLTKPICMLSAIQIAYHFIHCKSNHIIWFQLDFEDTYTHTHTLRVHTSNLRYR